MKRKVSSFIVASLLAATPADAAQSRIVERIVAKVNGQIITKSQLDEEVQSTLAQLGPAPSFEEEQRRLAEIRPQVLERLIDNLLILQMAEERGLQVPPQYFDEWKANVMKEMKFASEEELIRQMELQGLTLEEFKRKWEQGLLIQEVRRIEVDNKISVSEPEIEKYYQEHVIEYSEPAKVRIREIVVRFGADDEAQVAERMDRLRQDIVQGADFAEVARQSSDSSSRDAGGDLGFFEEGELAEALNNAAFSLSPGEVSDVLRFGSAFYLIKVEEKTEQRTLPLDDVRKTIADAIFERKMREQSEKYIAQLRDHAIIEIQLDPATEPAQPAPAGPGE
ncbi:MAG: peptidylprolyl isomerase [Vicinamibacteria bacterium]